MELKLEDQVILNRDYSYLKAGDVVYRIYMNGSPQSGDQEGETKWKTEENWAWMNWSRLRAVW